MSSMTMAKLSSLTLGSSAFPGCCRLAGKKRWWKAPEGFLIDGAHGLGSSMPKKEAKVMALLPMGPAPGSPVLEMVPLSP